MDPIKALLVLALIVVVGSAGSPGVAAGAKGRPPAANGVEPFGSAEWPTVAAKLAQTIARASFAHKYGRVWGFLHPLDRRAVSESHWLRCQGSHPVAPATVAITQVSVASATELPVDLSLLGRRNVQDIELVVQYRTAGVSGPQLATLSTFWLEQKNGWSAVWLSDEYRAYSAGRCYLSPQGPPLY